MNGLRSIPRTHQGENLAYISPQEAQMLRQQGGGIAPDGGQLQGPGGIPSFEAPNWLTSGWQYRTPGHALYAGPPVAYKTAPAPVAAVVEEEPEERDTSELQAEIAALTAGDQQRAADRMAAMYANLGWGPPPPQFGSATEGGDQFFTEQVTANQMPAYAALLNDPSVIQALGSSNQAAPTNRPDLRQQVQQRAEEIRTASQGGMINRYDLGGLVNNMLLQAGRSTDNIPSNAVS